MYNIGLIGCGGRGKMQAGAWQLLPDASLTAICDIDENRLNTVGDELGVAPAKRYRSIDEMLACEELDIVAVATRTNLHATLTLPVLEAGIHAIGEKPIDDDLDDAHAMMETADKNGVQFAVHHQSRTSPRDIAFSVGLPKAISDRLLRYTSVVRGTTEGMACSILEPMRSIRFVGSSIVSLTGFTVGWRQVGDRRNQRISSSPPIISASLPASM